MPIEDCKIIKLPKITDPRGNISVIESGIHIPHNIQRVYYLYGLPEGTERGEHAHKDSHHFLVAISGSFDVSLDDGMKKQRFHLNRADYGLYICPMIWRSLDNFSSGSICMVLASNVYQVHDYVRDYNEFLELVK